MMPMSTGLESNQPFVSNRGWIRWRKFCEQWRHSYLLLVALFCVTWRISQMAIPTLNKIRFGGLHPGDVLLLMDVLKAAWVPPLIVALLYALS
jgi:hypothetical protein